MPIPTLANIATACTNLATALSAAGITQNWYVRSNESVLAFVARAEGVSVVIVRTDTEWYGEVNGTRVDGATLDDVVTALAAEARTRLQAQRATLTTAEGDFTP